jgi:hypothetical protein
VPGVYEYGKATCNPEYTKTLRVGGPWVAKVLAPTGSLGAQQVQWQPFIEKWTGTGWKRWWGEPQSEPLLNASYAYWGGATFEPAQLAGGGSGYYRAGGRLIWLPAWGYPAGGLDYLLAANDYFVGGGANSYNTAAVTTPYCWFRA